MEFVAEQLLTGTGTWDWDDDDDDQEDSIRAHVRGVLGPMHNDIPGDHGWNLRSWKYLVEVADPDCAALWTTGKLIVTVGLPAPPTSCAWRAEMC